MPNKRNPLNRSAYQPVVEIQIPGIQGSGFIWEYASEDAKKEIEDTILTPVIENASRAETAAEASESSAKDAYNTKQDILGIEKRIQEDAYNSAILAGIVCREVTWTLDQDISSGTPISIPNNIVYLVNRHHLRVSWNGLVLFLGYNFTEIGKEDARSNQFSLLFDAKEGDELNVWVGALGRKDAMDALEAARAANYAIEDLSKRVVYWNKEKAEGK